MRFLILGAGALGGYFGAKFIHGGADVEFLVRPRRAEQLAANGIVVREGENETRTAVKAVSADQVSGSYDVIFLTCKAYDLDEALEAIAPAVGPATTILPVLNGFKHIDILTHRFGSKAVLGGMTLEHGALQPNGVIVRSPLSPLSAVHGVTTIGELSGIVSDRSQTIRDMLQASGLRVVLSEAILSEMWGKFALFACAATIATLCRSRAGAIAAAPAGRSFIDTVIEECGRVAAAEGYLMSTSSADFVRMLFSDTASGYGPSMLSDVENNRRTEGEHVIGDMVDRGIRHAITVPILTAARCNLQVHEINRQRA